MENLAPLDACFFHAQDSDPYVSLAIGATSVMSGSRIDCQRISTTLFSGSRGVGAGSLPSAVQSRHGPALVVRDPRRRALERYRGFRATR